MEGGPTVNLDKDLQAIQEVRNLCARAKAAHLKFKEFSQEEVDKIVAAMAEAGFQASERLAKLAVSETGYGNVPDKTKKNQFCTRDLYESIRELRTVGIIRGSQKQNSRNRRADGRGGSHYPDHQSDFHRPV